jgi:signal transduction histidine kinase
MAAGVAHDFNNVLLGVGLAFHVLEAALPPEAREREALADGLELVDRGARLVKQLLTFARQSAHPGPPLEVEHWLGEMLPGIARSLGPDVRVNVVLESGAAHVALAPPVFEQIVVNLTNNARDAMPGGGEITIRTRRQGMRFLMTVSDNGLGMDQATRQQIFEPFFTTKDRRGTGLGLAIVFGAVRSTGGTVSVESEPGRGATFTLEFPIVASPG